MPIRLLVGPTGSGKTTRVLGLFKQFAPLEHEGSVRLIAPTDPDAAYVRRRLLSDPEFPGLLGNPVCTLRDLAEEMLAVAGRPARDRVSDLQKRVALREALARAPEPFSSMRESPNLPSALARTIVSLKSAGIRPDDLTAALESAGEKLPAGSRRNLTGVAAIYNDYERLVRAGGFRDSEDLLQEAVDALRDAPEIPGRFRCVMLDGFRTLSPLQEDLVRLIASSCPDVVVTLDHEDGRPEVFARTEGLLRRLAALPGATVERLPASERPNAPALTHLRQNIFRAKPPLCRPGEGVTLLTAPDSAIEADLAASEIGRLVAETGCAFEDIAVTARGISQHMPHVEAAFRTHAIPLGRRSIRLTESPLVRAVLLCLRAVLEDWRDEHVLGFLKSGFAHCPPETCAEVEAAWRASDRRRGRGTWFEAWGEEDRTLNAREQALEPLCRFADAVRPLGATSFRATLESLARDLVGIHGVEPTREDAWAWRSIGRILEELEGAERLIARPLSLREYADLLEHGIRWETAGIPGMGDGGVTVRDVTTLGGLKFPIIFIIGLQERRFPRLPEEDPLLRDFERRILNPHIPRLLDLHDGAEEDERYLFYAAASAAEQCLYLCCATDAAGLPSLFLDEAASLFDAPLPSLGRNSDVP